MTATLLADDRIKDRRNQFRREASRQEFLSPLAESRSQAPPGDARTRGSASAAANR